MKKYVYAFTVKYVNYSGNDVYINEAILFPVIDSIEKYHQLVEDIRNLLSIPQHCDWVIISLSILNPD